MLMGCSSGRLITHGSLDASGTMLHYFLAGAYVTVLSLHFILVSFLVFVRYNCPGGGSDNDDHIVSEYRRFTEDF